MRELSLTVQWPALVREDWVYERTGLSLCEDCSYVRAELCEDWGYVRTVVM
jgi:hypothetical protein